MVLSTRCFLQILIITRTDGDMSHSARVGIFKSGLRMTDVGLSRLTVKPTLKLIFNTQFCRIKRMWNAPPPPPPPSHTHTHTHCFWTEKQTKANYVSLYIILKGIYRRFRISLNNCEFTKFWDFASVFASWSQTSRLSEIGQISKFFFRYTSMKSGSIR